MAVDPRWAQVIDVEAIRTVTEWLPGLVCPCGGTITFAEPPTGAHAGAVSYARNRKPRRYQAEPVWNTNGKQY